MRGSYFEIQKTCPTAEVHQMITGAHSIIYSTNP